MIQTLVVGGQPKLKNLVVLVIILVFLIQLPYYIYVCGTSSHTAVFIGKRKIT